MNVSVRNRLVLFDLLWGLVLAVLPAVFAFDDPLTLSPFLVSSFVCSALAGVASALLAGKWVSGRVARGGRSGMFAVLVAGVLHGLVFSVLASFSLWVCLAINISGFSTATPGNLFDLASNPGIFEMSGIAAGAVFVCSLAAGLLFSPLCGSLVFRAARAADGRLAEAAYVSHESIGKGNT